LRSWSQRAEEPAICLAISAESCAKWTHAGNQSAGRGAMVNPPPHRWTDVQETSCAWLPCLPAGPHSTPRTTPPAVPGAIPACCSPLCVNLCKHSQPPMESQMRSVATAQGAGHDLSPTTARPHLLGLPRNTAHIHPCMMGLGRRLGRM
jgi:hypothetical protein